MKRILISILVVILLSACTKEKLTVAVIDGTKAHEMYLDGAILLDVRTMEEYMEYRLENSILIPVDNLNEETISEKVEDKNTNIIVYCRSGNRSKKASEILIDLGYTNVYDMGSIDNYKK